MKCKCGNEIENVPRHLEHLASWVCKDCSNTPPSNALVGLTAHGSLEDNVELETKKYKAEHAA